MIFVEILKTICIFFDWLIYSTASYCYVLFASVCGMNTTSLGETFNSLMERLAVFVGIIMLFVVAFSLLQSLVDPDKLEKSAGNLVKKVAISIVLLVSSSFIFGLFDEFQTAILENNTIEQVILGTESDGVNYTTENNVGSADAKAQDQYNKNISTGRFFSYNMLFAFVKMDDNIKNPIFNGDKTLYDIVNHINDSGVRYEYPIISGIVGIFIIVMLVSFAIEIGVRAFTIMILQALAPIPIIAYVAPKGDGILQKYFKTYISAYLQLFVKIAVTYITLYLMMFTMNSVLETVKNGWDNTSTDLFPGIGAMDGFTRVLLLLIVMIALFKFSKTIPKLLGDIFGIKMDTTSLFKDTKAVVGGALGLGIGAVGGVAAGVAGGAGVLGTIGALGKGAVGGATTGARSKDIKSFVSGQSKNNEANKKWATGVGAAGGVSGLVGSKFGGAVNKIAGNPSKLKANEAAMAKNQKAIEKVNTKIQSNAKGSEMYNKIKSTGEKNFLSSSGYNSKQDYVNSKALIAKRQWEDYTKTNPTDSAGVAKLESDYRQTLINAEASYNKDVSDYTKANIDMNPELNDAYKEYQNYVSVNRDSYGGHEIESFDDIEVSHNEEIKNINGLNDERRSLEQEKVSIENEKDKIISSKSSQFQKKTEKYASANAEKLGHYESDKKK